MSFIIKIIFNTYKYRFSPITMLSQWRQKYEQKQRKDFGRRQNRKNKDFMAFIRIVRVHCTERELEDDISAFISFILYY